MKNFFLLKLFDGCFITRGDKPVAVSLKSFKCNSRNFLVINLIPINDWTALFSIARSNDLMLNSNYTITPIKQYIVIAD